MKYCKSLRHALLLWAMLLTAFRAYYQCVQYTSAQKAPLVEVENWGENTTLHVLPATNICQTEEVNATFPHLTCNRDQLEQNRLEYHAWVSESGFTRSWNLIKCQLKLPVIEYMKSCFRLLKPYKIIEYSLLVYKSEPGLARDTCIFLAWIVMQSRSSLLSPYSFKCVSSCVAERAWTFFKYCESYEIRGHWVLLFKCWFASTGAEIAIMWLKSWWHLCVQLYGNCKSTMRDSRRLECKRRRCDTTSHEACNKVSKSAIFWALQSMIWCALLCHKQKTSWVRHRAVWPDAQL